MKTRERFETQFTVTSYEVDFVGNMNLHSLFNRFQELANNHADYLKVGYELLRNSGLAWVLSRIKLDIISYPKIGDTVVLATWPKGVKNLFALRDFSLKNSSGETLALATSCWLMIDINTIRPKRIEDFRTDLKFPNAPHAIEELPDKISLPTHMYPVFEKDIMISDLDTNHHTNNTQYVKWICDCFSVNKYLNNSISSIQINFLSETLLHDKIKVLISSKNDKDNEFFVSGKNLIKDTINFHSKVHWK